MTINITPIPRLTTLVAPAFTLGTANAAGSAITAVASDSTLLAYDTTVPAAVGASAATGSATTAARRDHVHDGVTAGLQTTTVQGSRTASAGAGDQAITGAGFVPTAVVGFGEVHGEERGCWGTADDARADAAIFSYPGFSHTGSLLNVDDGAGNWMNAVVKSYDADGLTLTWTKGLSGQDVDYALMFLR